MNEGPVRYYGAAGHFSRVIIARLRPGTDLGEGILSVCKEEGITAGVIISCIGSLQKAVFTYPAPDPSSKVGASYLPPTELPGPIEFLGAQGFIGLNQEGKLALHLHATICDAAGHVYGGHFNPGGNPVLVTMEVAIGQLAGVTLAREYDPETDLPVTRPRGER